MNILHRVSLCWCRGFAPVGHGSPVLPLTGGCVHVPPACAGQGPGRRKAHIGGKSWALAGCPGAERHVPHSDTFVSSSRQKRPTYPGVGGREQPGGRPGWVGRARSPWDEPTHMHVQRGVPFEHLGVPWGWPPSRADDTGASGALGAETRLLCETAGVRFTCSAAHKSVSAAVETVPGWGAPRQADASMPGSGSQLGSFPSPK